MLCALCNNDKVKVEAVNVEKAHGPFVCPECLMPVILRKCRMRVDHFAHIPPVTCEYGQGESEQHRKCKIEIYESLKRFPNVTRLELERNLHDVRPDVSCYIGNIPVAIEVQISALSYDTILRRTQSYAKKGICLIWVGQWKHEMDECERYSPKLWEKWCHAAFFGRVYYWEKGCAVIPYHFGEYLMHVTSSEWYDSDGEEHSAGGYSKISKRYRSLIKGRPLCLANDFVKRVRSEFVGGKITIPSCKLFMDGNRDFPQ